MLKNLQIDTATLVVQLLGYAYDKVGRLNRLLAGKGCQEETVYDLVDVGPNNQFVVLGNTPMIVHNCQSVGHDAHVLFQVLTAEELSNNGFDWYPWHMDLHDCLMFAVHRDRAEEAAKLLKDVVYPKLNKMLGGEIHLKGEPNICLSWADDKDETYDWKTNEKTQSYLSAAARQKDGSV